MRGNFHEIHLSSPEQSFEFCVTYATHDAEVFLCGNAVHTEFQAVSRLAVIERKFHALKVAT